jgi:RNA polymerase sigma-19 factor, ECF subfamily
MARNKNVKSTDATTKLVESVFAQHRKALQEYLVRRLSSTAHAQDIAQEAYLRLLSVEDAELVRQPHAYLFRIASNLVYEYRLRERNDLVTYNSQAVDHFSEQPQHVSPEDLGDRLNVERQLEAVLSQLPPLQRAILIMRKRDGLSYVEIAQAMGISVHTVKKYLLRAVTQCRDLKWEDR